MLQAIKLKPLTEEELDAMAQALMDSGNYRVHRAVNDCLAANELLASPLPASTGAGPSRLLESARKPTWRIWAENSPFDLKDVLNTRQYKWNPDGTPFPKVWYTDVPDDDREARADFLAEGNLPARSSTAYAQDGCVQ